MKSVCTWLLIVVMDLVMQTPAIAAVPGPKNLSARVTTTFIRDAISGWGGSADLSGRWRINPDWNIWFDGEIHGSPVNLGIRGFGLELTGRYSAGEFSLWVPGKIKLDEGCHAAALAVEAAWRLGRGQVGAELGWEQEWSDDPLRGYGRYHGQVGVQWFPSAKFRANLVLNVAMRQVPSPPADDYVFVNAKCESRWSPGPRTTLKTGLELAAYRYPDGPDDNRTRYEWTSEFSWRPGNCSMRLGGEFEWSDGRLSENYQFQQLWARADVSIWGGILSASARLDGTRFLDPVTTARDRLHWQLVTGFSRAAGDLSARIQLFYDSTLLEDGTGQWAVGPVAHLEWRITDRICVGVRWAPEGDFSGGADELELSFSFSV